MMGKNKMVNSGEKDIPVLKTELKPIFTKALGRAEQ